MKPNPKSHDALFKWLIAAFTEEFFAHYFPALPIGRYRFLDKEFISKYEALKESLKGDLFLMLEVDIDGQWQEVVIQIEHQRKRQDVAARVYEYACYAWLLKQKPVWSIVVYTDAAIWRKDVPNRFWHAFDSQHRQQFYHFDVIKINAEKSADLIRKHTMLCKLLALQANEQDTQPEQLIYEIYQAAAAMQARLTNEQLLLIEQWASFYKKIPEQRFQEIKKEVHMSFVATTITEYIQHESELKGERKGQLEGELKGQLKGKIETLETLYAESILSHEEFEQRVTPLRQELKKLLAQATKRKSRKRI